MKRSLNKSILIMALAGLLASFALPNEYGYRREIKGISDTWHQLTLPNDVLGKVNDKLSDLRIIGITPANDTIEVPYMLKGLVDMDMSSEIPTKVLNQVKNDKGHYITFDIGQAAETNGLWPVFSNANFDWHVTLEASQDQKEWFTLTENYRILRIKNSETDYSYSQIKYPTAKYQYYRLFIPTTDKPVLQEATLLSTTPVSFSSGQAAYRQYTITGINTQQDKEHKQTIIDISLPGTVPVSRIYFGVKDKFDYFRPVTVQYLSDSVNTPAGWRYNYTSIATGKISSVEEHKIEFDNKFADRLRLVIDNRDNEPLHLDSFVLKGNLYRMYARFTQPATYYLLYGSRYASAPAYDIEQFRDKIPGNLTEFTLGAEQATVKNTEPAPKPLFENKAWLWAIMVLIILMLGWFTLRMMRKE